MTTLYHYSVSSASAIVNHSCDPLDAMDETIGSRLQRLRKSRGLTQAELARKVGVGQSTIGNIEAGIRGYGASVVAIAKTLGVSPDYLQLATGAGEMLVGPAPTPIDLEGNPDYPAVRRVKFKLSAGVSGFGVDYLGDDDAPIVFRRAWFTGNGYRPLAHPAPAQQANQAARLQTRHNRP